MPDALNLSIRPATEKDADAVVALWRACDLVASYNDPAKDFRFALGKPNSDILLGTVADGRIAGSVLVGHDGHRGWIYYVAADPAYRKQKVGRRMVDAAEAWLKKRGVAKAMLLVRETNTQVVDFYTHIGYEAVPRTVMQRWL